MGATSAALRPVRHGAVCWLETWTERGPISRKRLVWMESLRQVETSREQIPDAAPIEEAARTVGMDPDAARAAWVRHPELADLFVEVGRIMERARNSGRRRNPETMLADLALAAQAEREGVAITTLAQFIESTSGSVADEREDKRRCQAAARALETLRDWIEAA